MKMAFDVGANMGVCTEWLLKNKYDKVISVEPDVSAFNYLSNKYRSNERVILLNNVLSDESGVIDFYECSCSTLSTADIEWINSSRFAGQYHWSPTHKTAITFDQMFKMYGFPDFLKIDVEGSEYQVIKGMTQKIDCIIGFEWAEEKWEQILLTVQYLQKLGYTQFSFTNANSMDDILNLNYCPWNECEINNNINPTRKREWGMIYTYGSVKK